MSVVLPLFFFNSLHFEILKRDISLDVFCSWILKQIRDTRRSRACGLARWTLATLRVATRSVDEPDWLTPLWAQIGGGRCNHAVTENATDSRSQTTLKCFFFCSPPMNVTVMQSETTSSRTGRFSLGANGQPLQERRPP